MHSHMDLPEAISINDLCKLMGISRSRYYQLLGDKLILPPVYNLQTRRPYFPQDIAKRNLQVKQTNVGINGTICLFYNARKPKPVDHSSKKQNRSKSSDVKESQYHHLIEGLEALGVESIKVSQVKTLLQDLYPNGRENISEGEVLKALYCAIHAQNSRDNVNR